MTCAKSPRGPLFLDLEAKWHPTMGTTKSFQDRYLDIDIDNQLTFNPLYSSITMAPPEMVKNIGYPGIFYR